MPLRRDWEPRNPYFVVRRSRIQGRGAVAVRAIREGARIIEYTGERIGTREADERYDDAKMARHHTFLFAIDDDAVIDGDVAGNDARFINHSCDPNCEALLEDRRVFIYAKRAIAAGEELAYDYMYDLGAEPTPKQRRLYVCHCGTPLCRGHMAKSYKVVKTKRSVPRSSTSSRKVATKSKPAVSKRATKATKRKTTKTTKR